MLSADGVVDVGVIASDSDCCPLDLCAYSKRSLSCNFVNILPSGPLWDQEKRLAGTKIDANGDYDSGDCISLVSHAVYTGHKLHSLITGPLYKSLIESNPFTAFETMDSWLLRLGWQDCYNGACRNPLLGNLTPYEKLGDCGRVFCGGDASEEIENAVKHAIIVALSRLNIGGIKNNEFINWVIEPLGVRFEPQDDQCPNGGDVNDCSYLMQLTPFSVELEEWKAYNGCEPRLKSLIEVEYINQNCNNSIVNPALLAAHCIVLSMLHCQMKIKISLNA